MPALQLRESGPRERAVRRTALFPPSPTILFGATDWLSIRPSSEDRSSAAALHSFALNRISGDSYV